jgi:hypothetical protein
LTPRKLVAKARTFGKVRLAIFGDNFAGGLLRNEVEAASGLLSRLLFSARRILNPATQPALSQYLTRLVGCHKTKALLPGLDLDPELCAGVRWPCT